MKRIQYIKLLGLLTTLLILNISCQKEDENLPLVGNGLSDLSWTTNQTYVASAGQTLTFSFSAQSSWTAQYNPTTLLSLDKTSGNKGNNTLKVTVHKSSLQQGTITIRVNGYPDNSQIKIQFKEEVVNGKAINYSVDQYLKERYLWNDEYKTLTPDFTQEYDAFLENTLMSMQTNILDKKLYSNSSGSYYSIFSYIQKLDPNLQSRSTTRSAQDSKTQEYNYGFVNMLPVRYSNSQDIVLVVQGVHPDSSADDAGIKRGIMISQINNVALTRSNWAENYLELLQPSSVTTLQVKDSDNKTYTINSGPIYPNPVIFSQVKDNTGYLVYSAFESGFDQELFDVFKNFKSQGITNLILDFRYNGGGDVKSANLIASCVAGAASSNKTFASYRYNDERMIAQNNQQDIEKFAYSNYPNLNNISLSAGGLNLNHIYCLVSDNTASASELVINALKGIDVNVTLIGTTTRGKNVGMEGTRLSDGVDNYILYPITFQTYNAKGFGAYENGFTPDETIDEDNPNQNGFERYGEFGTTDDPLYAKAISMITGTRSLIAPVYHENIGKVIAKPSLNRIGMVK